MATLEAKHRERLAGFKAAKASLPALELEVKTLEVRMTLGFDSDAEQGAARRQLEQARRAVQDLREDKDEIEYLLSVGPLLMQHALEEEELARQPALTHAPTAKPLDLSQPQGAMMRFVSVSAGSSKGKLLKKYQQTIENVAPSAHDYRIDEKDNELFCPNCQVPCLVVDAEAATVCPQCEVHRNYLDFTAANLSYSQETQQDLVTVYAYKRLNHFTEWLNSIQARETTEVDPAVLDALRVEFRKVKASTADITPAKVRAFLKKLKLTRYYEHTHYITAMLTGARGCLRGPARYRRRPPSQHRPPWLPRCRRCPGAAHRASTGGPAPADV